MAISRVVTWNAGQILTKDALNAEFDNILNNALTLVSPLSGSLNANNNIFQNVAVGSVTAPGMYFINDPNTGFYSSAGDTIDVTSGGVRNASFVTVASGVNFVTCTPAAASSGPSIGPGGSDTDASLNVTGQGLNGVLFNTNSGVPAVNNLYRASLVQAWCRITVSGGTPTLAANYNVVSFVDVGTGAIDILWDRDFVNVYYGVVATPENDGVLHSFTNLFNSSYGIAGITTLYNIDTGDAARDPASYSVVAFGLQ